MTPDDAGEIVAVDLGGTHARFAIASLGANGRPILGEVRKYKTAEHAGLSAAWKSFARDSGRSLPAVASIAIAGPVEGELIRFTNNGWTIRPAELASELGIGHVKVLNDFAAMSAAVGVLEAEELRYIGGPVGPLPTEGVTTVIGPGTGLGVGALLRWQGRRIVLPTEGGHVDFAPLNAFEEELLRRLRRDHPRVSIERIVSGPGLRAIRETLAAIGGKAIVPLDDAALWEAAIDGDCRLARDALDRLVMALGSVTGDLTLAHGSNAVVLTGGLANRIHDLLAGPLFNDRFRAKGRFARRMAAFPIRLAVHPEAGLLGAAAAYQEEPR